VVDEAPCPCCARRDPAPVPGRAAHGTDDHGRSVDHDPAHGSGLLDEDHDADDLVDPGDLDDAVALGSPAGDGLDDPAPWAPGSPLLEVGDGEDLPPGPWRWRWVWPTPGRVAGMALVAADGTLVLWSAGGFAPDGAPPDGRPTADVAAALARLPELTTTAAGADDLRSELERARAVADEAKRLLNRAVGAVDDEIGTVHRPDEG
jgi:hypothetical protein